jgi:two-component system phosphate regulon response regulator OmpR
VTAADACYHLLVVDDDDRLRALLERFLTKHGYHVSTAADVAGARAALKRFAFDLLILDVMLPDASGLLLTEQVRAEHAVPILLLTARKEVEDRIRGLEAGADDYLSKPFEPRELLLRVQRILERSALPPAPPARREVRFGRFVFDLEDENLTADGEPVHLTSAERQLLATLAATPGEVVDRPSLAEDADIAGADRAVDTQVARLRRKLEDDPRHPRFLVTVRGRGYALKGVR